MKETLQFLRDLSKNNNKNWFDANKDRYLAAKATVEALAGELLSGIRSFDDTVGPLSPKDCTYRIYRDLRFSKDKTPYKTHMGLYINRGGKKSGYSGYYFHVGAKSYGNMVAIGEAIWVGMETYCLQRAMTYEKDINFKPGTPKKEMLREITIPPKVWHITDDVFDGCSSLKKVIIRSKVLEDLYWVPEGCEVIKES